MRRRKIMMLPFTAVALVVAFAAVAFACTIYRGEMTVEGDASTSTAKVVGNGGGMSYCSTSGQAFASATGGQVEVTIGPTSGCGGSRLGPATGSATYFVNYVNLVGWHSGDWLADCMSQVGGTPLQGVNIGTMSIDSNGNGGPQTYNLPVSAPDLNAPTDQSAVCVSSSGGSEGLQAPLTIQL